MTEKEKEPVLKDLLNKINYHKYQWMFCGDLKMISITLGVMSGNAKNPCFLCNWEKASKSEDWPTRKGQKRRCWIAGQLNVKYDSMVPRDKVLLPPLHIKLGVMTQLAKQFIKDDKLKTHLQKVFPKLSDAKIQGGVFCGADIRKLIKDKKFPTLMNSKQREAWEAFIDCINNFFGNFKSPNYKSIVERLMKAMKDMGCRMTVKVHFLDAHIDYFSENLGELSEEQGGRFHQEISRFENDTITVLQEIYWQTTVGVL